MPIMAPCVMRAGGVCQEFVCIHWLTDLKSELSDAERTGMSKRQRLRLRDVQAVTRLAWEATELRHDPLRQQRHLIDGLAGLVGAQQGFALGLNDFHPGDAVALRYVIPTTHYDPPTVEYMAAWGRQFGVAEDPATRIGIHMPGQIVAFSTRFHYPGGLYEQSAFFDHVAGRVRMVDILPTWFRHRNGRDITCLAAHRLDRDEPVFSPREVRLAWVLSRELRYLYQTGRLEAPTSPVDALPPRQREIARRLLEGEAPKRIAFDLGLSIHTVRDHIKAIYQRLEVSGRAELMARCRPR